jgi:hypothetical protein
LVPSENKPRVDIDIPGVTADTTVGNLTVRQLVDLMVQVQTQIPIQRGMPDPKVISDAIAEIHRMIAEPDAALRRTQTAIIEAIPKVLREGPYAPKDGGPSPHARGTVPTTQTQVDPSVKP